MEESDIKSLLKLGYWPIIAPTKDGIWKLSIYKKKKDSWIINKQKLFNDAYEASEWSIEYLSNIYYAKQQ